MSPALPDSMSGPEARESLWAASGGAKKKYHRKFTSFRNLMFVHWGKNDPGDQAKATYLYLISCTRGGNRLIYRNVRKMAAERGITPKTFRSHTRKLAEHGLLITVPRAEVDHE